MNSLVIPPSPSWYLSSIISSRSDGLVAYGARHEVVILKCKDKKDFSPSNLEFSFLPLAHKERVNGVLFNPSNVADCFNNSVISCGDDGLVRLWDLETKELKLVNSGHQEGHRVVGIDWSVADPGMVVSVSDTGLLIVWDLHSNKIRRLQIGPKVSPLCLAACPHDKKLVAVGAKNGLILIANLKGEGSIKCRMRSHESDIVCLSWCPVKHNIFQEKGTKDQKKVANLTEDTSSSKVTNGTTESGDTESEETSKSVNDDDVLLLASGAKDRMIYFWRAGTDGRYETLVVLPLQPLTTGYRTRMFTGDKAACTAWITINWVDPYTLLSSSQFGELLEWDLRSTPSKEKQLKGKKQQTMKSVKALHGKHSKGLFAISCPVLQSRPSVTEEDRFIWTTALDKKLVCTSLQTGKVVFELPTIGGIVYCMSISTLDPNRIALGLGDSKIFVWNMGNTTALDISPYWQRINSKVMALEWHPTEENWLAFGTGEGRVGLYDVSSSRPPIIFRQHHRRCVYRLCWAPHFKAPETVPAKKHSLALYSVGDGEVLQLSVDAADKEPVSLSDVFLKADQSSGLTKSLNRSDFVWKSDRSRAALGNENGVIYILDGATLEKQQVIYAHKKLVQCLNWHPMSVTSDSTGLSPYQNWLASASDSVRVFNVESDSSNEVAVFSLQTEKIVDIAWSPHFNGRLVSVSYDYTAQVWDVVNQVPIVNYYEHHNAVLCAAWSPLDPDFIITGSADNSLRVWKLSEQPVDRRPLERKKNRLNNRLKKLAKVPEATDLVHDKINTLNSSASSISSVVKSTKTEPDLHKDVAEWETGQVNRTKGKSLFPVSTASLNLSKHLPEHIKRWQEAKKEDESKSETRVPVNGEGHIPPLATRKNAGQGYLDFFFDGNAMRNLLITEEAQLSEMGHTTQLQQSMLWRGDITEVIKDAMKKKQLTDWLVSLAPMASLRMWQDACTVYAEQLSCEGDHMKAASYLVAVHKVEEAVTLLAEHKLYKEALALAKCRMPSDDPLIKSVMTDYANYSLSNGMMNLAAHCFLSVDDPLTASQALGRCKDLKSLRLAALLSREAKAYDMANNLAKDCFTIALMASDYSTCTDILNEHPDLQYLNLWANANKFVCGSIKLEFESQVAWLHGEKMAGVDTDTIVDKVRQEAKSFDNCYPKMKKMISCLFHLDTEKQLWLYVSSHLSLAGAADCNLVTLQHLVLALSSAYRYQVLNNTKEPLFRLCMLLFPKGPVSKGSILGLQDALEYTEEEKNLLSSMYGFLMAGIVSWLSENIEQVVKHTKENGNNINLEWLKQLSDTCIVDLFHSKNIEYFKNETQIKNLEQKIASSRCTNVNDKRSDRAILTASRKKTNPKSKVAPSNDKKTEECTEKQKNCDKSNGNKGSKDITEKQKNCDKSNENKGSKDATFANGTDHKKEPVSDEKEVITECSAAISVTNGTDQDKSTGGGGGDVSKISKDCDTAVKLIESEKKSDVNENRKSKECDIAITVTDASDTEKEKETDSANRISKESTEISVPDNYIDSKSVDVDNASFKSNNSDSTEFDTESIKSSIKSDMETVTTTTTTTSSDSQETLESGGKLKDSVDTDVTIPDTERLRILKEIKSQFESSRISAPNPFASFCELKNIVQSVVKDNCPELFEDMKNQIENVWQTANGNVDKK